jgi:hypothetical protein
MSSNDLSLANTVTARLTLDVTYRLNGENAADVINNLRRLCTRAIEDGMLTGELAVEVDVYSMDVVPKPEALSEEEVADLMMQRIEGGALPLEDIPSRLAKYGLMESIDFTNEMRERIEMARSAE